MRLPAALVAALALAVPVCLAGAVPAHADPDAPSAYDFPSGQARVFPPSYPSWASNLYARVDARWGRADRVVPTGMATQWGFNLASDAVARECTPDAAEGGWAYTGAQRTEWIDAHCQLSHNDVELNVGSVAAPSDTASWESSGSHRLLFYRYSTTSACLDGEVLGIGLGYSDRRLTLPWAYMPRPGLYLCLTQGFTVLQKYYEGGSVHLGDYRYTLRAPWSVYRVVNLGPDTRPTNVIAQGRGTTARVSWSYPQAPNVPTLTGSLRTRILRATTFTVSSSPDTRMCRVTGRTSCTVTGLRSGVTYTFTVRVEFNHGSSESGPSNSIVIGAAAASPAPSQAAAQPSAQPSAPSSAQPSAGAATPSAQPSGAGSGSGAAASTDVRPLEPRVTPVGVSSAPQPGGNVRVTSMVVGQLQAGQTVGQRSLIVCYSPTADGACSTSNTYVLSNNLMRVTTTFLVPRSAAGGVMRVQQLIAVSPGPGLIGAIKESPVGVIALSR